MNSENPKIKKIIEQSGHNFHYQVVKLLRDKGWTVQVSPYYRDNITDKSREIDIIAEKSYEIAKYNQRDPVGALTVKLFIECKQFEKEFVFWFDRKNEEKILEKMRIDFCLPNNYDFSKSQYRYYTAEKVAKLFDSGQEKKENEEIFKAINQCLHGMIYYRYRGSLLPLDFIEEQEILGKMFYPIIVVNSFDKFYRIDPPSNNPEKINENFLIEVNYAYLDEKKENQNEYFLIDVVEYKKVSDFVENILNKEVEIIKNYFAFKENENTDDGNHIIYDGNFII